MPFQNIWTLQIQKDFVPIVLSLRTDLLIFRMSSKLKLVKIMFQIFRSDHLDVCLQKIDWNQCLILIQKTQTVQKINEYSNLKILLIYHRLIIFRQPFFQHFLKKDNILFYTAALSSVQILRWINWDFLKIVNLYPILFQNGPSELILLGSNFTWF